MDTLTVEFVPTAELSALNMGSGDLDVLATPAVVAYAENVCKELIRPSLAEGETTVGTQIELSHLRASKIGVPVTVSVRLTERTNQTVNFIFEAIVDGNIVAKGNHQRAVVEQARFLSRLN